MADQHLVVFMPCYSLESDATLVELLVNKLNLNLQTVDLSNTYDSLKGSLGLGHTNEALTSKALANCKPRLRMTSLYAIAQSLGFLVVGTSNWNE
jgi:NAD+ synthase